MTQVNIKLFFKFPLLAFSYSLLEIWDIPGDFNTQWKKVHNEVSFWWNFVVPIELLFSLLRCSIASSLVAIGHSTCPLLLWQQSVANCFSYYPNIAFPLLCYYNVQCKYGSVLLRKCVHPVAFSTQWLPPRRELDLMLALFLGVSHMKRWSCARRDWLC